MCAIAVAWVGSVVFAQAPPAADPEITVLIKGLGGDSYALRERATRNLARFGMAAQPWLVKATESPDAEVRSRAAQVLSQILEADFQARLSAFSADVEGKADFKLPAWDRFAKMFGADRTARLLFVDMQRAEPALLDALDSGSKSTSELFAERCQAIQQNLQWNGSSSVQQQASLGTVTTLLFVGSAGDIGIDDQVGAQLYNFIHQPDFQNAIRMGTQSARLKKLLGMWIGKNNGAALAFQNLMLAFHFELPEGLDLAVKMLASDGGQPHVRQYALLAIGKFGNQKHLKAIEPFLKDLNPCISQRINNKEVQTQVRDIALAVSVSLSKQSFKDYGFDQIRLNQQMLFEPGTVGFVDKSKREASIKKWQEWIVLHPAGP